MRSKLYVVLGVAAISAFSLFASTQEWINLSLIQGAATVGSLSLSGQDMNPTLSPVAIAGLAAALALTIAGRVFKYVLGALILLLGIGIVMISQGIQSDPLSSASSLLSEITGITGDSQAALVDQTLVTVWPTVSLVTGLLLALCGVAVLAVSRTWKRGGRKYESGTAAVAQDRGQKSVVGDKKSQRPAPTEPDRISDWEMLSGGDDPTDTQTK